VRAVRHPVPELIRDTRQKTACHALPSSIGIKETDHALRLLKWLNQTVEQQPVETTVAESDTILVMLAESVHGPLLCGEIPGV